MAPDLLRPLFQRSTLPSTAPVSFELDPEELELVKARWAERDDPEGPRRGERIARELQALRESGAPLPAELRDLRGATLIGADLSGLDLMGVDLRGADLSRANLAGANLMGAKLIGATLFETDLTEAELAGADLSGATLDRCRAERAGFGRATLIHASLTGAILTGATLTEADATGAHLSIANLDDVRAREVRLAGADLSRASLMRADLGGAYVDHALFDGADLREGVLRGVTGYDHASWIGADIRDIDFTGAYLCRRHIHDQNFLEEFRKQGPWSNRLYLLWLVTSDCGRSLTRWGLWTAAIAAFFALVYGMVAVDYGDHETFLSPLYYSVVTLTTLGYGDVLPASPAAQVAAMVQVVLGYVMLGGLLSIFSNKMARRAD